MKKISDCNIHLNLGKRDDTEINKQITKLKAKVSDLPPNQLELLKSMLFSGKITEIIEESTPGTVIHLIILLMFVGFQDWKNGQITTYTSQKLLAEIEGCSIETIRKRQRELERLGLSFAHFDHQNHPAGNEAIDLTPIALQYSELRNKAEEKTQARERERKEHLTSTTEALFNNNWGAPQEKLGHILYTKDTSKFKKESEIALKEEKLKTQQSYSKQKQISPSSKEMIQIISKLSPEANDWDTDILERIYKQRLYVSDSAWEIAKSRHSQLTRLAILLVSLVRYGIKNRTSFAESMLMRKDINIWITAGNLADKGVCYAA